MMILACGSSESVVKNAATAVQASDRAEYIYSDTTNISSSLEIMAYDVN